MKNWHKSQRGYFAGHMVDKLVDKNLYILTADLGYGVFDRIQKLHPNQLINTGAAEQSMLGAGVGMTLAGKTAFCYSITPFLIYRPLEWIRTFLHHDQIPVKLVGSGRDKDYAHDGITHDATGVKELLDMFDIVQFYPESKEEVPDMVDEMINNNKPSFISLER